MISWLNPVSGTSFLSLSGRSRKSGGFTVSFLAVVFSTCMDDIAFGHLYLLYQAKHEIFLVSLLRCCALFHFLDSCVSILVI